MSMLARAVETFSPEEYLAIERAAEQKSEYLDGEMFAMAGVSQTHNLIVTNLVRFLGNQLAERECNVYANDMRVKVAKIRKYTYPDVVVACAEQFEDEQRDTLLNPIVIIEVLSDSTEAYDRGKKFLHYQTIPSFAEYLLINQTPYQVEQYVRQKSHRWTYTLFQDADDVIRLETIGCELCLREIYAKIQPEKL